MIAGRHVDREDVGELGEIGLAEDHRASIAQAFDQERVALRLRIGERERARGRVLGVASRDVVLEENRDAFEGTALRGLRRIEAFGDLERIGIELANRIEARAGAIISLDARDIGAREIGRSDRSCGERLLQVDDGRILDAHRPLRRQHRRCGRKQYDENPQHAALLEQQLICVGKVCNFSRPGSSVRVT